MTKAERIQRVLESGKWFLRTSDKGVSWGGFKRKRVGAWNDAGEKWTGHPYCEFCGGFFGIDKHAHAFGITDYRSTLEFCEWRGERVVIDGDKICVSSYRVIATGKDIPPEVFELCGYHYLRDGDTLESGVAICLDGTITQRGGSCYCFGGTVIQNDGTCYCCGGTVQQSGGCCYCLNGMVTQVNGYCRCSGGRVIQIGGKCDCLRGGTVIQYDGLCNRYGGTVDCCGGARWPA